MSQLTRQQVIDDLRNKLSQFEPAGAPSTAGKATSTGNKALDRLLPGQGLAGGTLIEWLSGGQGAGAASLSFVLSARLQRQGGVLVVIDGQRDFCPPAAAALGIVLERTVVVRPRQARETLWVYEQSLRSGAVAAVVGWFETVNDRAFRRLQLAAETGGGVGFLLRPFSCRAEPTWAAARLLVEALPSTTRLSPVGRRLRIEPLYCRGGTPHKAIELELSDEATDVHPFPSLVHPAPSRRAAGA